MAEPVPYHVIDDVALEIHNAASDAGGGWFYLSPVKRDRYRDMAEAAIEAAEPYLRRKARAELLEEISDGLIAARSDAIEQAMVFSYLAIEQEIPPRLSPSPKAMSRTLYRRAKEERRGR